MFKKIKDHFVSYDEEGNLTITIFSCVQDLIIFVMAIISLVELILLIKKRKKD